MRDRQPYLCCLLGDHIQAAQSSITLSKSFLRVRTISFTAVASPQSQPAHTFSSPFTQAPWMYCFPSCSFEITCLVASPVHHSTCCAYLQIKRVCSSVNHYCTPFGPIIDPRVVCIAPVYSVITQGQRYVSVVT